MDHTDSSSNFLFLTYLIDFHPTLVMQKLQPLACLLQHLSSFLLSLRPPSEGCEGINLTTQCQEWILFSCFNSCCKFDHIAIVRLNPCCISSLFRAIVLTWFKFIGWYARFLLQGGGRSKVKNLGWSYFIGFFFFSHKFNDFVLSKNSKHFLSYRIIHTAQMAIFGPKSL